MKEILNYIKREYSRIIIWLFVPVVVITSFSHHRWVNPERVIAWDIKSYYAYLPAAFIYQDLSLDFIGDNPSKFGKWIWPSVNKETGKKYIITSMGQSFLYAPFFFLAHGIAKITPYEADGYTVPYAFALHFSTLFYFIVGMFFLRRLLLRYFEQRVVTLTILILFLGTNLLYYTAFIAPLTHTPEFSLISILLFYIDSWYKKQNIKYTIVIGTLSGLITLIRPTNILVLIVLIFWNTFSTKSIFERTRFFLNNYRKVLLMIVFFILIWIPQFAYWKYVSGKFFYFSYGELGASFYWSNPQIFDVLLSYRKGWWVYTPIMLIASLSVFILLKYHKAKFLPVTIFLLINIYVQASWWCWWFGGSFGQRVFVDSYGILAFPLAALISFSFKFKKSGAIIISLLTILTVYSLFQTKQFNKQAIHYWWMSRTGYWMNFLKPSPAQGYWETVPVPDYDKARKGVYVSLNLIDRKINYKGFILEPKLIVDEIKKDIGNTKSIEKYARNFELSIDSAKSIRASNIYERKRSLNKYLPNVLASQLSDSIIQDKSFIEKYDLEIEYYDDIPRAELYNNVLNAINTKDIDAK